MQNADVAEVLVVVGAAIGLALNLWNLVWGAVDAWQHHARKTNGNRRLVAAMILSNSWSRIWSKTLYIAVGIRAMLRPPDVTQAVGGNWVLIFFFWMLFWNLVSAAIEAYTQFQLRFSQGRMGDEGH